MHTRLLLLLWCVAATALAARAAPCACRGNTSDCSAGARTAVRPSDLCAGSVLWLLCDNALTTLPPVDASVHALDVARNRIANASDELHPASNLRRLDVSHNRLEHLRFLPRTCRLVHLDASGNRLVSLEGGLSGCSELEELVLSGNRLRVLSEGVFVGLGSLRVLSLAQNPLGALPRGVFRGLSRLRSLDVHSADLDALPDGALAGLRELRSLDLDDNHLRSLPPSAFEGLSALQDLHLCDNHLSSLPEGAFAATRNLSALFLDHNELSALPPALLQGLPLLQELWLQGNLLQQMPELRGCCAGLRVAALDGNRLREPSEAALRALLARPGPLLASLHNNPVRLGALAWAARASDVLLQASPVDCHCGSLALRARPQAALALCVEAAGWRCPRDASADADADASFAHWVDALTALAHK